MTLCGVVFLMSAGMLRFTYPQDLDVQRSKDQRAVDIYEGVEDVLNTVKLQHYPTWVLKYLPLKAMKKGREGLRRYKSAAMEYINEVESKGIPTSEDPAEGTIYEQLKAKGMPIESIVVIISDFVTGGAGTVSYCIIMEVFNQYMAVINVYRPIR